MVMKVKNFTVKLLLLMIFSLLIVSCRKDYDAWKELKTCPGIPSFMYEGQLYNTVQIGTQCWMAENLNVGSQVTGSVEMTDNGQIEKYCYDNDPENCKIYGGLYQWEEVMSYTNEIEEVNQGICPEGWHIPSLAELNYADDYGELKEAGFAHWNKPNDGATNSSGFTALPGGKRMGSSPGNYFINLRYSAYFWSTSSDFYTKELNAGHEGSWNVKVEGNDGCSIRCVKD